MLSGDGFVSVFCTSNDSNSKKSVKEGQWPIDIEERGTATLKQIYDLFIGINAQETGSIYGLHLQYIKYVTIFAIFVSSRTEEMIFLI